MFQFVDSMLLHGVNNSKLNSIIYYVNVSVRRQHAIWLDKQFQIFNLFQNLSKFFSGKDGAVPIRKIGSYVHGCNHSTSSDMAVHHVTKFINTMC